MALADYLNERYSTFGNFFGIRLGVQHPVKGASGPRAPSTFDQDAESVRRGGRDASRGRAARRP